MNRTNYTLLLPFLAAIFFAGSLSAQLPHLIFHAEMNGSEQIPAVATNGKGLITIMYSPDRDKVTASGLLVDIQGDVTAIDLHIGKTGEVGAFMVSLLPAVHGKRIRGDVAVPVALLQNLLPDRAYVTVKTTAHPNGEIRGQFICETDLDFRTALTGAEVVPSNTSSAFAFASLHFPTGSEDIVYAIVVRDFSSPITEVGIYQAVPGQNGTLVQALNTAAPNGIIQGLFELGGMTPDFLRNAREGKYYLLIKTQAFPDGELRGQIGFMGYFTSSSSMNALQVVPSQGGSPGFGLSHNVLNQGLDSITSTIFVRGITPTSVNIHVAPTGVNGPMIATLQPTPTLGLYRGTYALGATGLGDLAEMRLYVNVPTAARPNGELRGQMKNSLRKGYAFDLCGAQMVPPSATPAFGVGMASVDQVNCYLNYKVIFDHMSGIPSEAFICQAFPTMNGNALYPMPVNKPIMPGYQEIASGHGVAIELGETYIVLITEAFPNGEIRGQIVRGFSCPAESGVSVVQNIAQVAVSPVPFNDVLNVTFESQLAFEGRLVLYDILGSPALTEPVQIVVGSQTLPLQTGNLPPGYYSLMLETPGQGSIMMLKKLIRQE